MNRAWIATTVGILCLVASSVSASTMNFAGAGKVGVVGIHSPVLGDLNVVAGKRFLVDKRLVLAAGRFSDVSEESGIEPSRNRLADRVGLQQSRELRRR